ncbi:MAG: hypothetical protein MJE68_29700 [Proteobacteria bacterium]|nr:hypothetical protein [Pseudomonadota bacterium]
MARRVDTVGLREGGRGRQREGEREREREREREGERERKGRDRKKERLICVSTLKTYTHKFVHINTVCTMN